jgi:hypothetical protein
MGGIVMAGLILRSVLNVVVAKGLSRFIVLRSDPELAFPIDCVLLFLYLCLEV